MASIEKRGNTYTVTVSAGYDVKGKKIREKTTFIPDTNMTERQQQKALEKFAYNFEERVKNGKYLKGEKITFKEFTEQWLKEYAKVNITPSTYNVYVHNLDTKILPAIGHLKLSKIQPLHLQSFYNNLLEDGVRQDKKTCGYSPATIKKIHVIISSILNTAMKWQAIDSNPCTRVTVPKQQKLSSDIKNFTLEQAITFLNALEMDYTASYKAHERIDDTGLKYHVDSYSETREIPLQFKVLFNLSLYGGLRRGEVLALSWSDIDFKNRTISITKSTCLVGKEMVTKEPKTKSSERTITMPASVIEMLKKYKTEQKELKVKLGDQWQGEYGDDWQERNFIFIQWNGKQMSLSTPYHTFKDIIEKYNATVEEESLKLPNIPFHGLRHTAATLLISQNVDVKTVSARLGHAQTSTTMNIYAHSLKKSDETAADVLDNILAQKA